MPIAMLIIGTVLVVAGLRGTEHTLGCLLANDFTGQHSFVWWAVAIILIGTVGYVADLKSFSDAFIALLIVVLVFANGGVFQNAIAELHAGNTAPSPTSAENAGDANTDGSSGSSGGSGSAASIFGAAGTAIQTIPLIGDVLGAL